MKTMFCNLTRAFVAMALATVASSCRSRSDIPADVMVICDMSASIVETARSECPNAVESAVIKLRRGDSLSVVRVTGDADTDTSRDLRQFTISTKRALYDYDLQELHQNVQKELQALEQDALAHPYAKTDLIGTIRLVARQLEANPDHARVVLGLSDYIQDDDQFDFKSDPRLSNPAAAKQLGLKLGEESNFRLDNTTVLLGRLQSKDLIRLPRQRQQAIESFWTNYITALGGRPRWVIDNEEAINQFLEDQKQSAARISLPTSLLSGHSSEHDLPAAKPDSIH